ncbi:SRPBCC domain-containing protein [Streptomyces sp. URMC 123]|uniref:SRPBCC domain-containing protein n=1 Tax=Streptomyces sp. URMC 123 TaxID=3423403 RepID=UPI003F1C51C1
MTASIGYGTSRTLSTDTHRLRYELRLPHTMEDVWEAVATPEGLPGWLAVADAFEPRIGGAVTLRWLTTDDRGRHTVVTGTITAWEPPRLAEYSVSVHGRVRFELEPDPVTEAGTLLRFTNEMTGPDEERLSCLAGWHQHFEFLAEALDGRPMDWDTWSLERWRELYGRYETLGAR